MPRALVGETGHMSQQPLVTVLMSVYNDTEFLADAIESILRQTLTDFEFLIIDDGSTDETASRLAAFTDPRIRVVRNQTNLGLTLSLRRGVGLALGRYIARFDADDLCLPDRLSKQVAFLEQHPELALLGGACQFIDSEGNLLEFLPQPETDLEIRWFSFLANPFLHSTTMIRREVLVEHQLNYDEAYRTAQDYDLWSRLLECAKGANLSEALIYYRIRHGITRKKKQEQLNNAFLIAFRMVQQELPEMKIDRQQFTSLWTLYFVDHGRSHGNRKDWAAACELYRKLFKCFADKYRNRDSLGRVRREQGIAVMRSVVRSWFPPGWVRILSEVIREDPWLPAAFSLHLVRAAARLGKSSMLKRAKDSTPL